MVKNGINKKCILCEKEYYVPQWRLKQKPQYCSYKCYWLNKHDKPWCTGTKGLVKPNSGSFIKGNILFEGTVNEYKSLHYRIGKILGKPTMCEICQEDDLYHKDIEWANVSGKYLEIKEDWIRLCKKCHFNFDNVEGRRAKNASIFL